MRHRRRTLARGAASERAAQSGPQNAEECSRA
jgi:hypothetical protein